MYDTARPAHEGRRGNKERRQARHVSMHDPSPAGSCREGLYFQESRQGRGRSVLLRRETEGPNLVTSSWKMKLASWYRDPPCGMQRQRQVSTEAKAGTYRGH
jgi:hypothetical protein